MRLYLIKYIQNEYIVAYFDSCLHSGWVLSLINLETLNVYNRRKDKKR